MKVCLTLICCFFLSLQDGSAAPVYSGTEGGDVTVQCSFSLSRQKKVFCKNQCKEEDILIETTNNRAQSGRYSMEYKEGSLNGGDLFVTITQLTKSDSGRYWCRLGTSRSSYKDLEIIVTDALLDGNRVKKLNKRTGGTVTVECSFTSTGTWKFFCKNQCKTRDDILIETGADTRQRGRYSIIYITGSEGGGGFLFVTITQLTTSDSGRYRCRQGRTFSSSSHRDFEIFVSDGEFLLN
ncbi:polymeric immunoglobulin receptor-like [Seriola dumerili]|uniref:polymeric immunoglobulin receptor-like n=1 Tax=Seriola dumerili TaxID=41447 RepID=UPI000BBE550B|nr:polymeric immunoglobulin receptor-like [Seriola dumerili]